MVHFRVRDGFLTDYGVLFWAHGLHGCYANEAQSTTKSHCREAHWSALKTLKKVRHLLIQVSFRKLHLALCYSLGFYAGTRRIYFLG